MFDENRDYLVSTKYLYYILGSGNYNYEVYKILDSFIKEIQRYREYTDGEFDYYIMSGYDLNYLNSFYNIDAVELVDNKKKLIREVV